ncbi:MAG: GIY-YIG nuclease family protein [Actinomycetota bacterium]|jgi:Uri superfamily endonuclease|nr:GIY-YIG nuclease family protein [Actinomycetota bacterium]
MASNNQGVIKIAGGNYSLIIACSRQLDLIIGKLGPKSFYPGYYIYIGSAKTNINFRISRHLSRTKKLYWHIDYLLDSPYTAVKNIFYAPWRPDLECSTAKAMSLKLDSVSGFGSSDCSCPSHLYHFKSKIKPEVCKQLIQAGYKEISKF